jgi:hypothetical protein
MLAPGESGEHVGWTGAQASLLHEDGRAVRGAHTMARLQYHRSVRTPDPPVSAAGQDNRLRVVGPAARASPTVLLYLALAGPL